MQEQAVSKQLDENIAWWKQQFSDCADIKMRPMCLGRDMSIRAFLSYIEVTGGKNMMEDSVLGKMLNRLNVMEPQQVYAVLQENGLGVSDVTPFAQMSEAAGGMLTGDSILFVDGFDRALKIPDKGYPGMSLQKTESEKAIRGSNEGFGVHFFIRSTIRHNKDIFLFSIYHTAYGDNMKPAVFPCFLMQRFKIPFFLFLIPDFLQIILLCIFCLFRIKFSQNTNIFTDLFYGNSQ